MIKKVLKSSLLILILAPAGLLLYGCSHSHPAPETANAPASNDATPAATRRPSPRNAFEQDLQYVQDGQFRYVLVFSRKDGGAFTGEDITYLKQNAPEQTNQWIRTDEGKRVIAGSNFEFTPAHLEALKKRFNIEDYSGK